ncbi:MAG TPA: hypothetical protein VGK25_11485 [Ignavibacteria bacterium]|jgi:hypothetical protein
MKKKHYAPDREHDSAQFKAMFFPDEYNSEMPIFDDYTEPEYDDLVPPEEPEEKGFELI